MMSDAELWEAFVGGMTQKALAAQEGVSVPVVVYRLTRERKRRGLPPLPRGRRPKAPGKRARDAGAADRPALSSSGPPQADARQEQWAPACGGEPDGAGMGAGEMARYAADPVAFAREVLGVALWARQEEILEAVRDHAQVTVRSGHGVGKTFVAAVAALWWVFCHRPSLVLTTAPTARQVEALLWGEIGRLHRRAKRKLPGKCLTARLIVAADQEGVGLSTNEPERFAGWHREHLLAIVDEASGVEERIYETLLGVLTGSHNHLLLIGNPTKPAGAFYESHRREGWTKLKVAAFDTPNFVSAECGVRNAECPDAPSHSAFRIPHSALPYLVTPAWVAARKADWGEESPAYRVRVLAEFPTSAADGLIAIDWVEAAEAAGDREEAARRPEVRTDDKGEGDSRPLSGCRLSPGSFQLPARSPVVLGVDVARFGECETVVAVRRGDCLVAMAAWSGRDLMATCGRVVDLIRTHAPERVVVDPVGLGAGLLDRLRELQREGSLPTRRVIGENGGTRATDAGQFVNRRAELYHGLRERYRTGEIAHAPPAGARWPKLLAQLTALSYRFTSRGQWQIETKEELRSRGLPSPDWADAVALCFAPERPALLLRPIGLCAARAVETPLPRL